MDTKALEKAVTQWAGQADLSKDAGDLFKRKFVTFFRRADRKMRKWRENLLLDLANIPLQSPRLRKRIQSFEREEPRVIATFKEDIERIWSRDVPIELKQPTLNLYSLMATTRAGRGGLYAWLPLGYLSFGATNLPGQLVVGLLENWWRMARCGNPECVAPYFLAKRSTQKYCERGECTRYAVRQKALKWWTTNRAKASKQKSRKEEKSQ